MTTINYDQPGMTLEKQLELYDSLKDHPNPKLRSNLAHGVTRNLVELGLVEIAIVKGNLAVRAVKPA